ncbi:hypothetical protein EMQ25_17220 [Arsenicitalea aurantiaca]|uniref:Uncharacterized protein n=1 Tax=Arsenicitalea aurantiaca TaxID=1783274 RepID=A0A433X2S4_9HYPH|nr:hypothetical protein EMQ25_17220 [Arsenicitalea aurantiaca]
MNPLHPRHMSTSERLAALTKILALGLVRLRLAQSSEHLPHDGDSSLRYLPDQSGHATPTHRRSA